MYTIYDYIWFFMIYAFIGWTLEVAYAALNTGKFSNRGFLNGPVCPIYGCGMVIVICALTPIKTNFVVLFFGAFLLASGLELVTGYILEKLFDTKWWDYSEYPFNIGGYICLKFSIGWGLGGIFIMRIIQPVVEKMVGKIPVTPGKLMLVFYSILFISDISVTVAQMVKFRHVLKSMNIITEQLRNLSDNMGQEIYKGVMKSEENLEKSREELTERYHEIMDGKYLTNNRFSRAFPNIKKRINERYKLQEFKMPEFKMPDMKLSEIKIGDVKIADIKVPDIKMPELNIGDILDREKDKKTENDISE